MRAKAPPFLIAYWTPRGPGEGPYMAGHMGLGIEDLGLSPALLFIVWYQVSPIDFRRMCFLIYEMFIIIPLAI